MAVSALLAVLASSPACVAVSENVRYESRGGGYRGHRVDFVSADPDPGTTLPAGGSIRVAVTVRYVLQKAQRGLLVMIFRDQDGRLLELARENAIQIQQGRSTQVTVANEATVPRGTREMWLQVAVVPEGARGPEGGLRIRYPVDPRD